MSSTCLPMLQLDVVRLTRLDRCGNVLTTACSSAVSGGVVSVAMANNNQARQEYLQLNGQGEICDDTTKEPLLRWINADIMFCNVNPELYNIATSESLVLTDASSPVAIGWDTTERGPQNSFFALEGWTNTGGDQGCSSAGVITYGYFLMPFIIGGQVSDQTIENAHVNFTINARTKKNSKWGVGPYDVILSSAAATLGVPTPLLTSIGSTTHRRQFFTTLAPPLDACGCTTTAPVLTVSPLSGAHGAVTPTATFPLGPDGLPILPAYIDWGDGGANQLVTVGTTAPHTYATAGTFVVKYKPTVYSAPIYTSANVVLT